MWDRAKRLSQRDAREANFGADAALFRGVVRPALLIG